MTPASQDSEPPRNPGRFTEILARSDDLDRAAEIAEDALTSLPHDASARGFLHEVRVAASHNRAEWLKMEERVRQWIADEGDTRRNRWLLVAALFNQGEFRRAWEALREDAAYQPDTEEGARVWMALYAKFSSGAQLVSQFIDMAERFPDSELVAATAIQGVLLQPDKGDPDPAELQRFHELVARFETDFPESRAFFRITVPDDPEDIPEALRPLLEPQALVLDVVVAKVRSLEAPYASIATAIGRPYASAIVHRAAGLLPIRPIAEEAHRRDVEAALSALHGRIVCDTSSLNVLGYIRVLRSHVLATFTAIEYATPAHRDLIHALDASAVPSSGSLSWDVSTGRLVATEVDVEAEQRVRDQLAWMNETAHLLRLRDWSTLQSLNAPDAEVDDAGFAWLSTLDIATSESVTLYCDDLVTRVLAWNAGVPAFGTAALLDALLEAGELEHEAHDDALRALKREFCVGFPLAIDDLRALAQEVGFGPGASSMAFSHGPVWFDYRSAHETWAALCNEATQQNPDLAAHWVWAAVSGICQAVKHEYAPLLVAHVLVSAIAATALDPVRFAACLDAARVAGPSFALQDPLPIVLEAIQALIQRAGSDASPILAQLISELDGADREKARYWIFGLPTSEP